MGEGGRANALDMRLSANEDAAALRTFPTTRLTRLEAEAVNQVMVLSGLLEQGASERSVKHEAQT